MPAASRKAVVVGASSGIGKALAAVLAREGYEVGLMARRQELLEDLAKTLPSRTWIKCADVRRPEEAVRRFDELAAAMGGADLVVVNAGVSIPNLGLALEEDMETVQTNVTGFAAMAGAAARHFLARGAGHLVGISSIAALYASGSSPAYCASKAFVSNYLSGLRQRFIGTGIRVTDIRPGFVDTPLVRGRPHVFWAAPAEKAAEQIYRAIRRGRSVAYITRRWAVLAFLIRLVPAAVFNRFYVYSYAGELKSPK